MAIDKSNLGGNRCWVIGRLFLWHLNLHYIIGIVNYKADGLMLNLCLV